MVTLGFNIMVFLVLRNWESLTGGSFGISGIARPAWGALSFRVRPRVLRLHAGLGGGVVGSAYWILTSRWGRAFRAIRENEMRAETLGVSLRNYKLMAFAIGAAYAGIGGALFAPLLGYIDPGAFTLDRSIQFLMMVVMGGLGRFEGPFIGAHPGDGPARGAARLRGPLPGVLRAGRHPDDALHAQGPRRGVGLGDHVPAGSGPRRAAVTAPPDATGRR